ncbi:hypothetical protein ACOMHN_045988 [Nucella lapillus]
MERFPLLTTPDLRLRFEHDDTTADNDDGLSDTQRTSYIFYTVTHYMRTLYLPAIFLLGNFGNLMTIIIMRRMSSEGSTINIYFVAIAVMDMMFLSLTTVPLWLGHLFGFDLTAHAALCKFHTWLNAVTGTISCWCLVCMTVHRAVSVVLPHRVNLLCTPTTVFSLLALIATFSALFFSHFLIGIDRASDGNSTLNFCVDTSEDYLYFMENIFIYLDVMVYCLLPFIFLAVSNSILVWKLTMSVKAASRHLTHGDSDQVQARKKSANSVTLTVIVVSVAFLVLTLPNSAFLLVDYSAIFYVIGDEESRFAAAKQIFIHDVFYFFSITNGAVNFYLYCLTGRRFREECLKVLCCGRQRSVSAALGEEHRRHSKPSSSVPTGSILMTQRKC